MRKNKKSGWKSVAVIFVFIAIIGFFVFPDFIKTKKEKLNESINSFSNSVKSICSGENSICLTGNETYYKLGAYNLQIFGDDKVSNQTILNNIGYIIDSYDLIALEEIRDEDGSAFMKLANLEEKKYLFLLGPREGRSSSKEQYAIFYNDNFKLLDSYSYENVAEFERPPLVAYFNSTTGFSFVYIVVHTKPDDATKEILNLKKVASEAREKWGERNIIITGDLNSDCSYYNYKNENEKLGMLWLNFDDTTTGKTDCAYDRFIVSNDFSTKKIQAETDKLTQFNFDPASISDHFPIEMKIQKESD